MNGRDRRLLEKIVEYCNRVTQNLARYDNSYDAFCEDTLFQDACCMCVLQIGELVGSLSDELKDSHRDIPWRVIKDTRNVYVHSYGSIDVELVWSTLTEDIPKLKQTCTDILKDK